MKTPSKAAQLRPPPATTWESFRLSDKFNIRYGRANPGGSGNVPVVGSSGVFGWTSQPLVNYPTIVIGRKGTAGKPWLIKGPSYPSDTTFFLEPREGQHVDLDFLFFALSHLQPDASDDVIPSLQRHHLEALTLPLPSPEEQTSIASILCKIRAATEKEKRIAATLRELREAMMASLFAKGAPKRTGSATPAQNDPAAWKMTCLGKVAKIARGKFSHRPRNEPRFYGGKIPFIQTGDVARSNGRIRSYSQTLNESGLAISKLFSKGTIVLTIAANIGETGILEFDSAFPDSLVGITPDETVDTVFLEYYLRTQKTEMNRLAPKGTQKNINLQFLMPWPVPLPPLADQKRIARDLRLIDNRLEISMEKARLLEVLFQSTLEFLMTAPIRILGAA